MEGEISEKVKQERLKAEEFIEKAMENMKVEGNMEN